MLTSLLLAPIVLLLAASPQDLQADADPQISDSILAADKRSSAQSRNGTLLLRPMLHSNSRDGLTRVRRVELVFSAVDRTETGELIPSEAGEQRSYRVEFGPSRRGQKSDIDFDDYHTRALDLPSGTYTLSEVHYIAVDIGRGGGGGFGTINSFAGRPNVEVSYCLSDRSFIFDVGDGEVVSLGGIAIADLPKNRGRFRHHLPVAGIDMFSALVGAADDLGYFSFANIADAAFESDSGICDDARYNVAGW
ncbi:MAG: hypothetical protein AAFV54_13645 [Pseudomonadota bacterium]